MVKNLKAPVTPAQKNKALEGRTWPGRCCIFGLVSGPYRALKPLFTHMARKAYPEYDVLVMEIDVDPNRARCLRFLMDAGLEHYDFTLITDVDILMIREAPDLVTQHMRSLTIRGTECYDNYTTEDSQQMNGVHFVTRAWWGQTLEARGQESGSLEGANLDYHYDERMLYRIVRNSGLPMAPETPLLWNNHGLHLGTHRPKKDKKALPPRSFGRTDVLAALEKDPVAIGLYEDAAAVMPWLADLRRKWRSEYPGLR